MTAEIAPYVAGTLVAVISIVLGLLADDRARTCAREYSSPYKGDELAVEQLLTEHASWSADLVGGSLSPLAAAVSVGIAVDAGQKATLLLLAALCITLVLFVLALRAGPRKYSRYRTRIPLNLAPLGLIGLATNVVLVVALALT